MEEAVRKENKLVWGAHLEESSQIAAGSQVSAGAGGSADSSVDIGRSSCSSADASGGPLWGCSLWGLKRRSPTWERQDSQTGKALPPPRVEANSQLAGTFFGHLISFWGWS